jgi:hypothetical protein
MNRNMQPKIHRSATTYSVQNSISDTLSVCPRQSRFVTPAKGWTAGTATEWVVVSAACAEASCGIKALDSTKINQRNIQAETPGIDSTSKKVE